MPPAVRKLNFAALSILLSGACAAWTSGTAAATPPGATKYAPAPAVSGWNGRQTGRADEAGIAAGYSPSKPLPSRNAGKPNPASADRTGQAPADAKPKGLGRSAVTVIGSLATVVAVFLAVAWFLRRGMPKAMTALPHEAVEVLGRTVLAGKQHVHLVRFGNKLLLVSASEAGAETLAEITDPDEVNRLLGMCGESKEDGVSSSFGQVLRDLDRQRLPGSFLTEQDGDDAPPVATAGTGREARNA